MPSVQRGPIDFSGGGLVSSDRKRENVLNIKFDDYKTYDGGYLLLFIHL